MDLSKTVLWSDEHLVVVNKPAGILVSADGYNPYAPYITSALSEIYGRVWPVHRLDRETSGVLVLALTAVAHRELNGQFERRQVNKVYKALVRDQPPWNERTIKLPLRVNADRRHRTLVDHRKGKRSVTHLRVLELLKGFSLIEAIPETGRRHQIRVHLAAYGYPIIADGLYGESTGIYLSEISTGYQSNLPFEEPILGRLGLHASSLGIIHPHTGMRMDFQAPIPEDFAQVLVYFRNQPSRGI
jgi:RluA family pseudouridine synthase